MTQMTILQSKNLGQGHTEQPLKETKTMQEHSWWGVRPEDNEASAKMVWNGNVPSIGV